jgi:hypothetical protein
LDHDPLERLGLALAHGHEVNDGVDSFDGAAEAVRVGHVPLNQLSAESRGLARIAHQGAHVLARGVQRANDVAPHEARGAGDEDHLAGSRSKFCQ